MIFWFPREGDDRRSRGAPGILEERAYSAFIKSLILAGNLFAVVRTTGLGRSGRLVRGHRGRRNCCCRGSLCIGPGPQR
ncbi:hypothetical protein N7507_002102 [Penicillium longicatenatum]|nr:hypothetical protein N7507_002102 [Penicillium longicatenatum]